MPSKPRLLEQVLDHYREGDLHECLRLVRTLVEAAPQATAPRQLLAGLFARTGNGRQALAHYRRLLPQAIARGEVIRAIAFQKQIDVYDHADALAPGRWHELQKQLRERGLPFLPEGVVDRPWDDSQLIGLPRAWFERIAAETRFEIMGLEVRSIDVEAGIVWEVLAGRMRWSYALQDGRASVELLAADGDAVHVPMVARTARVSLVPELPVEVLRFEAGLARDLRLAVRAGLHMAAGGLSETRALLPTRPSRLEDFDQPVHVPAGSGIEPLTLPPTEEPTAAAPPADARECAEFGVRPLPTPEDDSAAGRSDGATADPAQATPPAADPPSAGEPRAAADAPASDEPATGSGIHALPPLFAGIEGAPVRPVPVRDPADEEWPADMAEGMQRDAGEPASATDGAEPQVERRRHPRVSVSYESRVAMLRLSGTHLQPVQGTLSDMSTSGFSIRFANGDLGGAQAALADAVVAVDLDLPGPHGALRVAAQVRWLDAEATPGETRLGIEFVLLTEPDRRRIAGTLAKAALAAHSARKAA